MKKKNKIEFYYIVDDILSLEEFQKLKKINHHGITRYDHSLRVSYYTYLITKKLHINYEAATRGALLHDFFFDEVDEYKEIFKLRRHPNFASLKASQYFSLSMIEQDIIKRHMFPITFTPPKYLESWIVDIVDDICAIFEKGYVTKRDLKAAFLFLFLFFLNYFR